MTWGPMARRASAYLFTRSGTEWTLQQQLTAPESGQYDMFGASVALRGDTAVVGAPTDNWDTLVDQGHRLRLHGQGQRVDPGGRAESG